MSLSTPTDVLFLLIIQTLGGFTSPPSDEEPEYYDVKLVFKPLHEASYDKNTVNGVQEFMVRGALRRDRCDANEVRSDVMTCVCVCVCVDKMEGFCSVPTVITYHFIKSNSIASNQLALCYVARYVQLTASLHNITH